MKSKPPATIVVTATGADAFEVKVESQSTTRHRVTVSHAYLDELALSAFPAARVVHEAFRFLLEHEPNTSILANFDLREIERHFPAFATEIGRRLKT